MAEELYSTVNSKMDKAVQSFRKELDRLRTGRASPALLDGIRAEYYGTPTPLQQIASITIPESRLIVIQPWDKTMLEPIEKAIQKANLGISPANDGNVIRISIPPLTEERRKEMVKVVKKMGEECKIALRNIRREANEALKRQEKEKAISEDDYHRSIEEVQKLTDEHIKRVDAIVEEKQKEILTI